MGRTRGEAGQARIDGSRDAAWWGKVEQSTGCWLWMGALSRLGYGHFWNGEREVPAHRYGYEMIVAPVPGHLDMDHVCCNPGCVKPAHLEPVTPAENTRRSKRACLNGHLFTDENTYIYPKSGAKLCTTCHPKYQPTAYREPRHTKWHAEAAALYLAGHTQAEIAERLGKDPTTVCRALKGVDVPARPRRVEVSRDAFVGLVEAGVSGEGLTRAFGVSRSTVSKRMREWMPGVKLPAGRPTDAQREWEEAILTNLEDAVGRDREFIVEHSGLVVREGDPEWDELGAKADKYR
jgi:hypothetical protein